MWHTTHDMNTTQLRHPSLTTYQHYSTAQIPHNYPQNGNGKWNAAGQRSAYSLPHPSHAQSNMRWKNQYQSPSPTPRPLSNSTRDLAATPPNPSFLHSSSHDLRYGNFSNGEGGGAPGGGRPRPASMYDSPKMMNSMPALNYHQIQQQKQQQQQNSKKSNKQLSRNGSMEIRQSPDELVRLILH